MRKPLCPIMILALLSAMPLILSACDGEGFKWGEAKPVDSGDQPSDGGGDGDNGGGGGDNGDNGGGGGGSTDRRFVGEWAACYSDDRLSRAARLGQIQYAVRLTINQNGAELSGSGKMWRVFREGATSADYIAVKLVGETAGDDAIFRLEPVKSGALDFNPTWYVRLASGRLVGMYAALDTSGILVRSGRAMWRKVSIGSSEVKTDPWTTAFADDHGTTGWTPRDKTGLMNLTPADTSLTGNGSLVEQRDDASGVVLEFDVTRGAQSASEITFTFGGLDLANAEMDWFALFTGDTILGVYGQYDTTDSLVRFGHAEWLRSPDNEPSAVTKTWVSAFSDTMVPPTSHATDYLCELKLQAQEGGIVSGSSKAHVQDNGGTILLGYNIENATITGSQVELEMTRTNQTFAWNLRIAGSVMVGSYRRHDDNGNFLGSGNATFHPATVGALSGTWASSFFDSHGETRPEQDNLALVTITGEYEGLLDGVGSLRIAGESRRRLLNVSGMTKYGETDWTWRGGDLAGDTTLKVRKAGSFLFSIYTNYTALGALEGRGTAVWIRTTTSQTFAE